MFKTIPRHRSRISRLGSRPIGGTPTPDAAFFGQNVCQNEIIWSCWRGRCPLNPLIPVLLTHCPVFNTLHWYSCRRGRPLTTSIFLWESREKNCKTPLIRTEIVRPFSDFQFCALTTQPWIVTLGLGSIECTDAKVTLLRNGMRWCRE